MEKFELSESEEVCLKRAMEFVEKNTDNLSIRPFLGYNGPVGQAAHNLIGNIAHDKFRECVSKRNNIGSSR